jgi:3-dehydrosphinganine reductase
MSVMLSLTSSLSSKSHLSDLASLGLTFSIFKMIAVSDVPVGAWVAVGIVGAIILIAILSTLIYSRSYNFKSKLFVITGGSSGIGKAVALELLKSGASVAIIARRKAVLDECKKDLMSKVSSSEVSCSIHVGDVTDEASMLKVMKEISHEHKSQIDGVITSAGISLPKPFQETTSQDWSSLINLNILGTRNSIFSALPFFSSKGGRIVCISSQAGQVGLYGYTAYSASKFALTGFTQALQQELWNRGILVTLAFPPDTDTPLLAEENKSKPLITKLLSESSTMVQPDVVAKSILSAVASGSPYASVGFDGWMLTTLTSGMGRIGTLWEAFLAIFTLGLWKFVGLFYVSYFYYVIQQHQEKPVIVASPLATETTSSTVQTTPLAIATPVKEKRRSTKSK